MIYLKVPYSISENETLLKIDYHYPEKGQSADFDVRAIYYKGRIYELTCGNKQNGPSFILMSKLRIELP